MEAIFEVILEFCGELFGQILDDPLKPLPQGIKDWHARRCKFIQLLVEGLLILFWLAAVIAAGGLVLLLIGCVIYVIFL